MLNADFCTWFWCVYRHKTGVRAPWKLVEPSDDIPTSQVIVFGRPGVGKSWNAMALHRWAKLAARRPQDPFFTTRFVCASEPGNPDRSLSDIFSGCAGADEDGIWQARASVLMRAHCLFIDDLGREKKPVPPTFTPGLSSLLDQRAAKRLFTAIITNISSDEIKDRYDDRVYSRLVNGSRVIKMAGADRRLQWRA